MAKKYYEGDLDLNLDWGGKVDGEGNEQLPLSGNQVQKLLKDTLNSKVGWVGLNETSGRYVLTKDEATFKKYLETVKDEDKDGDTSLIIGSFKAPFEYAAEIILENPSSGYLAILKGETGVKLSFYARTKDAQGNIIGEAYSYRITSTQNDGTQKIINGSINAPLIEGSPVIVDVIIDNILSVGTNNITITVTGRDTDATTFKTATVKVVNLSITDSFDISKAFDFNGTNVEVLNVFHDVTTNTKTTVYWYLDGELIGTTSFNGSGNNTLRYDINKGALGNGVHTLMFYAAAQDSEIATPFTTPLYYRNFFIVDKYTGSMPLFSLSFELPYDERYIDGTLMPTIFNAQEYAGINLPFAIYTTQQNANVDIMIAEGGSDVFETYSTILAEPGTVVKQKIIFTKEGEAKIKLVSGTEESFLIGPFNVINNPLITEPSSEGVILDLNAKNRNNKEENYDVWKSVVGEEEYVVKFNNFKWNTNNGWNNDKLIISDGSSIEVPFAPFAKANLFKNGYTFEIEFTTKNVYDEDGVICEIMNQTKTSGIKITASEAIFQIDSSRKVSSKFKSGETYRVAFVKTPTGEKADDYKNSRFIKLYVNGVLCGLEEFDFNTDFVNTSNIIIQGTKDAEIELSSIMITQRELTYDDILTNYMFNRLDVAKKNELYSINNIYNDKSEISADKLKEQIPVMIFYQIRDNRGEAEEPIERLEMEFSDKGYQIWMDIDYTDPNDDSRNFYWANACIRPQGTSSMKYPKKNYRIYTQKDSESGYLDRTKVYIGEEKDKYLKAKNQGLEYNDPFEPTEAEKGDSKAIKKKLKKRTYSFHNNAAKVKCWCLKADFAESSGTHNTGVARWWNDVLRNGKFLTSAQSIADKEKYKSDVRTTVDGFPIALFYKPLNGEMRFLGKYNFNNDKSTEDVFGFTGGDELDNKPYKYIPIGYNKPIIHTEKEKDEFGNEIKVPLATITEDINVFNNPDEDSDTYAYINGVYYMLQTPEMFSNPRMECWEILSSGSKLALFQQTDWAMDEDEEKIGYYDETNAFQESFESRFPDCGEYFHTYNIERLIKWLTSCRYLKVENVNGEGKLVPMTLDELKSLPDYPNNGKLTIQLHSINKPSNDTFKFAFDGNAGYSETPFEEITEDVTKEEYDENNVEIPVLSYRVVNGLTSADVNGLKVMEVEDGKIPDNRMDDFDLIKVGEYYYYWGYEKVYYTTEIPSEVIFGYNYVCVYPSIKYYVWKDFEYFEQFITPTPKEYDDTPRNRALKFAVEKYEHFKLDMTAAYYIYLMRFGGVDQTVKNAMLTTEGSDDNENIELPSKWYFINYDNDTILGVKNDGTLVFDPYMTRNTIEESNSNGDFYCYAGRNSTMWNNLEADADFMALVPSVDNTLNTNGGLNFKNTIEMFNKKQAGQWCEKVYNWDAQVKYIDTYTNRSKEMEDAAGGENASASFDYLLNVQGPRSAHREWWLAKRFNIFDSYYTTGTFKSDVVTFKCNGPSKQDDKATITSGEDVYYGYYKNNPSSAYKTPTTIKPGDTWELTVTKDATIGDPHAIFGSPNIEKIDFRNIAYRLTEMQMGKIKNESIGTKLKELLIGDHNNPQLIPSFEILGGGQNMEKLEVLDLTGCEGITSIEFITNMREFYAAGSGIKSFNFNKGGNIEKLELPIGLVDLTFNETGSLKWENIKFFDVKSYGNSCLKQEVTDFSMQDNFTALEIENSPELLKNHNFVLDWLNKRKERGLSLESCKVNLNPIEWHLTEDEVAKLMVLGEVSQKTIVGKIYIDKKLTLEEVAALSNPKLFGTNCFDVGSRLEIIAERGVYLASEDGKGESILEGDPANVYKLIIVGGDGNINPENAEMTVQEVGIDNIPVRVKHGIEVTSGTTNNSIYYSVRVDELERIVKNIRIQLRYTMIIDGEREEVTMDIPYTIKVNKRSYPSGSFSEIQGSDSIKTLETKTYTLLLRTDSGEDFNGNGIYYTEWSISGDAYNNVIEDTNTRWVELGNTTTLTCEVIPNYLMSSKFTLSVSLYKTIEGEKTLVFTTIKHIGLSNPDILLVRDDNPALFQRLYEFGFTTDDNHLLISQARKIDLDSSPNGTAFKNIFKNYTGYTVGEAPDIVNVKFDDFSQLESFDSLGSIADGMFNGCTKLKTIKLPSDILVIGKDAFNNCTSLAKIAIPYGVTNIGENAFNTCQSLRSIVLPDTVLQIGKMVFANCSNLTEVTLGVGITEIPEKAFYDSQDLVSVTFGGNLRVINNAAFDGCSKLRQLIIPEMLENVVFTEETNPFMGCFELSFDGGNEKYEVLNGSLYFNDGDKKWLIKQNPEANIKETGDIYAAAYSLCGMKHSELTVPSNIIFAGTNILNGSVGTNLKLTKRMSEHVICSELLSETKYDNYIFAEGETDIPNKCFRGSSSSTIELPSTIITIGDEAFLGCNNLTKFTIPSQVKKIGNRAFNETSKLQTIYLEPLTVPERGDGATNNEIIYHVTNKFTTMFVHGDVLNDYREAWNDYAEYIQINTLPIKGYFRIIENGLIHFSPEDFDVEVSDVKLGNNIVVKQLTNGYYYYETYEGNTNTTITYNGNSYKFTENYFTIFIGDNTGLYSGNGIDLTRGIYTNKWLSDNGVVLSTISGIKTGETLNPIDSKPWYYDANIKGYRSPSSMVANEASIIQLDLERYADENGEITIKMGQSSESFYDHLKIKDNYDNPVEFEIVGNPVKVSDLKNIQNNDITIKLPVKDSYYFSYEKDGSNDYYLDCVWIKSIGIPVFNEPILNEDYIENVTIYVSVENKQVELPNGTMLKITNGTYYNAEFIIEDGVVNCKLPKNEVYYITCDDFMIKNKHFIAFKPVEIDTSSSVDDVSVEFTYYLGCYVVDNNGEVSKWQDGMTSTVYLYADIEGDYYIHESTLTSKWSEKTGTTESELYVDTSGGLFSTNIDGSENTKIIKSKFGSDALILKVLERNIELKNIIEWYIPSWCEFDKVKDSEFTHLLNGKELWTSNLRDERYAWVFGYDNEKALYDERKNEKSIMIFGKRKI